MIELIEFNFRSFFSDTLYFSERSGRQHSAASRFCVGFCMQMHNSKTFPVTTARLNKV